LPQRHRGHRARRFADHVRPAKGIIGLLKSTVGACRVNYLRWTTGKDIAGRPFVRGLVELYTEIDDAGLVTREVGVDRAGGVVHRAPSSKNPYGLFDSQTVEMVERENDITQEAFERLWQSDQSI